MGRPDHLPSLVQQGPSDRVVVHGASTRDAASTAPRCSPLARQHRPRRDAACGRNQRLANVCNPLVKDELRESRRRPAATAVIREHTRKRSTPRTKGAFSAHCAAARDGCRAVQCSVHLRAPTVVRRSLPPLHRLVATHCIGRAAALRYNTRLPAPEVTRPQVWGLELPTPKSRVEAQSAMSARTVRRR